MTDIVQREAVIHPVTGEFLQLDTLHVDRLANLLADIKDLESRLREMKSLASREVLRRQDREAKWTTPAGGYVLKGSSPTPTEEWDELALREDLYQLVDNGVITEEAADAAVETVVTYKVRKAGINALRKLGGAVAETVDKHCREVEKTRYISVSRSDG